MKPKQIYAYMKTAEAFAECSYAIRKKVGAVAVTPQDVMVYSWNGTAINDDNTCEDKVYFDGNWYVYSTVEQVEVAYPYTDELGAYKLVTKDDVLHAEANIVAKAAREGVSLKDSVIVVTLSPCLHCSKQLFQAGVSHVVYKEEYRDMAGVQYLKAHGILCEKFENYC